MLLLKKMSTVQYIAKLYFKLRFIQYLFKIIQKSTYYQLYHLQLLL